MARIPRRHLTLTRDAAMFLVGLVAFFYEVFAREVSDPQIVYMSGALMAGAAWLRGIAEAGRKE